MQDEYVQLRRRIEDGLEALDEMQRRLEAGERTAEQRDDRPKLRLIKGGLIGAGIWAGVEWLRSYKRSAVALLATGATVGGVVIAEQPHSPGNDPPAVMKPPASVMPSAKLDTEPTVRPTPRLPRTSPLRTHARIAPPPAALPSTTRPAEKPTQTPTRTPTMRPTLIPTVLPSVTTPTVSLPVTPTVPIPVPTPDTCTINLLGILVCLPHG